MQRRYSEHQVLWGSHWWNYGRVPQGLRKLLLLRCFQRWYSSLLRRFQGNSTLREHQLLFLIMTHVGKQPLSSVIDWLIQTMNCLSAIWLTDTKNWSVPDWLLIVPLLVYFLTLMSSQNSTLHFWAFICLNKPKIKHFSKICLVYSSRLSYFQNYSKFLI